MIEFFDYLPSVQGLERNLTLTEAEQNFIHPCGDKNKGKSIYKLLTKESLMLTYEKQGDTLFYISTSKLHEII